MHYACGYEDCSNFGVERDLLEIDAEAIEADDPRRLCQGSVSDGTICGRPLDRLVPGEEPEHIPADQPSPPDIPEPVDPPPPSPGVAELVAEALAAFDPLPTSLPPETTLTQLITAVNATNAAVNGVVSVVTLALTGQAPE